MRILQLAPLWESVPPPAYGGTEAVVHILTEELVAMGHDVTLVASGDSLTSARLHRTYHRSLRQADDLRDRSPYDWTHVALGLKEARGYDVVHNHAGELAMAMSHLLDVPMLTTTHCLATDDTQFVWDRYEGAFNTISMAQTPPVDGTSRARFMGHVYNAIDVKTFPFQAHKSEDLLFLSRIAPEKGPDIAIEVAKRTGRRLILAGKVDHYDQQFFDEVVRDLIDGDQIVFVGEADATRKRELYGNAKCVLLPLTWEEPFGLVMPEAMACGTPVVAFRRGSAPELIRHGVTGYVVDAVDEMVEAVQEIERIDAVACRKHVEANFDAPIMAQRYVDLYQELAGKSRRARSFQIELSPGAAAVEDESAVA